MKTGTLTGDPLHGEEEVTSSRWGGRKRQYIDGCTIGFCILGGLLVGITVLALANITMAELANPANLLRVAASSEVIGSILLTFGAGASAVLLLIFPRT